ncbi:MAG: tetratricopeptide repeat protein [Sphingobacteriaceae bacterium]|nr:tetratricopeptide repeat protein [Sphingobacteriaceae bacterium]
MFRISIPSTLLLLTILFQAFIGFSQKQAPTREQILLDIKNAKHDTERVKFYIDKARILAGDNTDSVLYWMYLGKSIATANIFLLGNETDKASLFTRNRFNRFSAVCLMKAAMLHQNNGNLGQAMHAADSCLAICKQINDKKLTASAYNGVAIIKTYQGNIKEALWNYEQARKIYSELDNKSGIVTILINQAVIFSNTGEIENCIKYYREAIELSRKEGMKENEGGAIANLAGVLVREKDYNAALVCLERGMQLANELSDENLKSRLYYTMGVMNYDKTNYDQAYEYFNKSKEIQEREKNYFSLSNTLSSISNVFSARLNYKKAIQFSEQAHRMNLKFGAPELISHSSEALYSLYKKIGNKDQALAYLELHNKMKDSIQNEGNRKEAIRQHVKNEYEIKATADSVSRLKERVVKNAELAKRVAELKVKKNQQYALFAGLFAVLIFGLFMYNRFKISQKQKRIIEEQKEKVENQKAEIERQKQLVEFKQKEMVDSIKYANRIQMAQFPSDKQVSKSLERLRNQNK